MRKLQFDVLVKFKWIYYECNNNEQPWLPFSELLMEWDEGFHNLMLNDKIRMMAYKSAIKNTVKPGDVVLDIGTGTGILSKWALQAGAKKVYAIEMDSEILSLAIHNMSLYGFKDKFIPFNEISFNVELPERVDVVISEIIGNLADNEDFQPIIGDALIRFLKPTGVMIPQSVASYIVPISSHKAHSCIKSNSILTLNPDKYNLKSLLQNKKITDPFNIYYDTVIPFSTYLSKAVQLKIFENNWDEDPEYNVDRVFKLCENNIFTGFKGYFVANLCTNVILDISGDGENNNLSSDSWKHAFLPIKDPISVRKGDILYLNFSRKYPANSNIDNFRQLYRWKGKVVRNTELIGVFDQNMDESDLL